MQKFFRSIRRRVLAENKLQKYLLYATGEILLVVIGILIALQINNWNTRRIERKEAQKSYRNIRRQVLDDQAELTKVKGFNNFFSARYAYANQIIAAKDHSKTDTLALLAMGLSQYSDFHRSGHIYETLVNSGEWRLLKNSAITSRLQQLEMTYNHVNKLEDIHWEVIINELSPALRGVIDYSTIKAVRPEQLYSVEMQNIVIESIFLTRGKDSIYNRALEEIRTVVELIDEELGIERDQEH